MHPDSSVRRERLRAVVLPLVVTLAYGLAVLLVEKIQVTQGLGWDGKTYGTWAAKFPAALRKGFDDYYVQRILPSGLIYSALGALGLSRTTPQIIAAFEVANVLLIAISAASYECAARCLRVSREGRWLGAIGLFGSLAILKYSAFYPVLTDVWGFAFGMLQVQFYLSRRFYALLATTALGAFVWPTLLPFGACLLVFNQTAPSEEPVRPAPLHLNDVLAGLLAGGWCLLCIPAVRGKLSLGPRTGEIDLTVVSLSVLISAAYLFWGARQLLNHRSLFSFAAYRHAVSLRGALSAVLLVVAAGLLRARLTNGPSKYDLQSNINQAVFSALKEPGIFALAHVLYWGPLVLVILLEWRHCVAAIHRAGIALTLIALGGLALSLNGESRKLVNVAPLFFLFALPRLDQLGVGKKALLGFGAASLLLSRVWLQFDGKMPGDLQAFPSQLLFMAIGPWMSRTMYVVQLAIVAFLAALVLLWRYQVQRVATPGSGGPAEARG